MTTDEMIEEIDEHGEGLTTWETEFISGLMARDGTRQVVSRKQHEIIRRIFRERVPEEWQ